MRKSVLILAMVLLLFSSCSYFETWTEADSVPAGTGTSDAYANFTGAAPSSVNATKSRYSGAVNLSWNSVSGADYYEVYRAETASSSTPSASSVSWTKVASPYSTSYYDEDVEDGVFYAYRVRARSESQIAVIGSYSSVAVGWTLSAPSGLSATKGESEEYIEITWESGVASAIKGYKLEWSTTGYDGDWTVAVPSGSDAEDYTITPSATTFIFYPYSKYRGRSIYFRMSTVSTSGKLSDASSSVLGYTYDEETAPSAPESFAASKGLYTSSIVLEWKEQYNSDGDDLDWEILRSSSSGESDKTIYSTLKGKDEPEVDDGMMYYTDTASLSEGVTYSYTIRAINDGINGSVSTADGYLLSPPGFEDGYGIEEGSDSSYGFSFTLSSAVGEEEHEDLWTYVVYGSADGSSWSEYSSVAAAAEDKSFFYSYDGESNDFEYFKALTVSTEDGSDGTSGFSGVISFTAPAAASGYSLSDNLYLSNLEADSSGNYPLVAILDEDEDVEYYNVRVWSSEPSSASDTPESTATAYPEAYSDGVVALYDIVENPVTGWTYYVAVQGVDKLGREGSWSKVDSGYAAITDEKLVIIMQAFATKPWAYIGQPIISEAPWGSAELSAYWDESEIYKKVKAQGLSSVGSATQSGFISGSMYYSTTVSGTLQGVVTFILNSYKDVEFIAVTGENVMEVNISGNGSTTGSYTIEGLYPATVTVSSDKMKIVNNDAEGYYEVKQSGRSQADVAVNTSYEGQTI